MRVPISGQRGAYLTGQAVLAESLATAAARSEPHRVPGGVPGAAVRGARVAWCGVVYPGCTGAGSTAKTRATPVSTSAYTWVSYPKG